MTTDVDYEELFDTAVAMTKAGRHREAIDVLEGLIGLAGVEPRLLAASYKYLGDVHLHEMDDPARAEHCFRQALTLFPRAERASLGLFHSLMGQERVEDALMEARRFVALRPSQEYSRLLAEILHTVDDDEAPSDES